MATQNLIHIPALTEDGRIIVPEVWLGQDIEYRTNSKDEPYSAQEYQSNRPPTLAELRHAFFGKDEDGNWVSPEYRQNVLDTEGGGEWTSTFLRDGEEAVERPERVHYDEKHNLWIAEGGDVRDVELPLNGWVLEYDRPTGFPSRTGEKEDAVNEFGEDASYFYATRNGLRAVLRLHLVNDDGPFYVGAGCGPGDRICGIGSRLSSRSE